MKYILQFIMLITGLSGYAQTTMYTAGFVHEPFTISSTENMLSSGKTTSSGYNLGIGWFVSPQLMRSVTFSSISYTGKFEVDKGSPYSRSYTVEGRRMALNLENLRFLGSYEIDDRFVMYRTWGWSFHYVSVNQSSIGATDNSIQEYTDDYVDMGIKLGLGSMYKLNNHVFIFGECRGLITLLVEPSYGLELNVGLRFRPLIGLNKRSKGK